MHTHKKPRTKKVHHKTSDTEFKEATTYVLHVFGDDFAADATVELHSPSHAFVWIPSDPDIAATVGSTDRVIISTLTRVKRIRENFGIGQLTIIVTNGSGSGSSSSDPTSFTPQEIDYVTI